LSAATLTFKIPALEQGMQKLWNKEVLLFLNESDGVPIFRGYIKRVKETRPLGYIVKPFTENGLRSNIEIAWNNYKTDEEYLSFSTNNELYKIRQSQILYLKAFDNYCYVITSEREYLVPKTLKFLASQLNSEKFTKTHRSYLVNLLKIESLKTDSLLINNVEIPVSNSKKNQLRQLLQQS